MNMRDEVQFAFWWFLGIAAAYGVLTAFGRIDGEN